MLTCDYFYHEQGPFEKFHAEGTLIKAVPNVYVDLSNSLDNKLYVDGRVVATKFQGKSDERLKENIVEIKDALDILKNFTAKSFNFKDSKNRSYGFIAQEVDTFAPDLVSQDQDGFLSIAYVELIPLLTRAIQQLSSRVDNLERNLFA